ncbi:MAG: MFS transporter [Clostridiaceae bacterium]
MKLNTKRTILVGLAFLSISSFWQVYDNVIPLILKNTFNVSDTISGIIMAMDNVLALFMLPLFGKLSDGIDTPLGKRTPFIIGGTISAVIVMIFIPISDNIRSMPLFIGALFLALLAMSTYRSPAVALMPDVTPKPLRSKANAIINLMGAVGAMLALVLIKLLVDSSSSPNYLPLFIAIAVIMIAAVVILLKTINEKKLSNEIAQINAEVETVEESSQEEDAPMAKDVKKSLIFILLSVSFWFMGYNAITTAFSKYYQIYWGMTGSGYATNLLVATVAAIVSYIPIGVISTKIGRKKTILAGVTLLGSMFAIAFIFTSYHPSVNILFAVVGFAWAAINVNSYPMVVEMSKGSDVGKFTGYYYTFSMSAQIATPILSGFLLDNIGYESLFPYATFFVALSFITMLFVKHGDSKPVPARSKLEAFDVED